MKTLAQASELQSRMAVAHDKRERLMNHAFYRYAENPCIETLDAWNSAQASYDLIHRLIVHADRRLNCRFTSAGMDVIYFNADESAYASSYFV